MADYVYGLGIDEPLRMRRDLNNDGYFNSVSETFFYYENGIGSIYALADGADNVVERYDYTTYGEVRVYGADGVTEREESLVGNVYGFQGRRIDWETATVKQSPLYYFRLRIYSPSLQRFLQPEDYSYDLSYNAPPSRTDPYGEEERQPTDQGDREQGREPDFGPLHKGERLYRLVVDYYVPAKVLFGGKEYTTLKPAPDANVYVELPLPGGKIRRFFLGVAGDLKWKWLPVGRKKSGEVAGLFPLLAGRIGDYLSAQERKEFQTWHNELQKTYYTIARWFRNNPGLRELLAVIAIQAGFGDVLWRMKQAYDAAVNAGKPPSEAAEKAFFDELKRPEMWAQVVVAGIVKAPWVGRLLRGVTKCRKLKDMASRFGGFLKRIYEAAAKVKKKPIGLDKALEALAHYAARIGRGKETAISAFTKALEKATYGKVGLGATAVRRVLNFYKEAGVRVKVRWSWAELIGRTARTVKGPHFHIIPFGARGPIGKEVHIGIVRNIKEAKRIARILLSRGFGPSK